MSLTLEEAKQLKKRKDVKSIGLEKNYSIQTDIGPQWIGAQAVWEGMALDTPPNKGEGIVIGIIDTGINPSHPSFQEVSEAGTANQYTHNNPRGRTYGECTTLTCNDKLIGIYDYTDEGTNGIDSVGHGSHVAGIAAGNVYSTNFLGINFKVSGVAPRANIISYKACFFSEDAAGGSCSGSALLSSIDQATADLVDVVNYSIGSETPCSPWGNLDGNGSFCGSFGAGRAASAMLNARQAGVVFVVSAGNSGPGKSTVGYPAVAPWVITAANTTHSRQLQSSVVNFTGGNSSLADLTGVSQTGGIGPLKIVHAKDFGNALCGTGDPELKSLCSGTGNDVLTGSTNPFAPNTFNGEIVVCDRGSYGRVEKGFNVLQAGAGGYILANTVGQQESIVADGHCLPATHLGNNDGSKLRDWLDSGAGHMGEITGQTLIYDDSLGDVMNSSSSRGPLEIVYNSSSATTIIKHPENYMKPNLSAPGTSIFSATQEGAGLTSKSGTSMSSPHIAGAAALVKAAHPNYSPSMIVSSLVLTANNTQMLKEDKATKADFADQGAGRTQVDLAIANSIYFDVTRQEFINANPQNGADISQLNLPELINDNCYPSCSFTRRVKLLDNYNVVDPVWDVSIEKANGLNITVTPDSFDFTAGNEVILNIAIDTTADGVIGDWAEAKIVFTVNSRSNSDPMTGSIAPSVSKVPLAVFVPAGNYPDIVERQSATRHGRFEIDLTNIAAMSDATYVGLGFKIPELNSFSLSADANNTPFNDDGEFEEAGSSFSLFEVTDEKIAVVIESNSSGSNGADLYVGQDLNINDTPDEFEVLCKVTNALQIKRCVLNNVRPGKYWILSNNKSSNGSASINTELAQFDINDTAKKTNFIGFVQGTGLYVKAPVKAQSNTTLDVAYELPALSSPSNNYFAVIAVGANPASVGKTAIIPVKITANDPIDQKLYSLNNEQVDFTFSDGDQFSNFYIDTGINAEKITLYGYNASFDVNFYLTNFDFDPLNIKPDLSALIPAFTVSSVGSVVGVTPPGFVPTSIVEIDVSNSPAARWYVEILPMESGSPQISGNYLALSSEVEYGEVIQPNQSLWFNPSRSGWGVDLSQSQTNQAVTWYTYNDDGTEPIWSQATGSITNQNQWRGDLNLVTWNGTTPKLSVTGSISMIYTSASSGVISIALPDKTYTEKLISLYSPENNCPEVNGSEQLDITGLWFLPDQSGFGSTVLATETHENTVFYFYDDLGLPVWSIGSRAFSDTQTSMEQASNGFCPDCEFSAINLTPIGSVTNNYNDNSTGSVSSDLQLLSPLSGRWISNGESLKLNKNFGCNIN
ncbi:MAG: S8 family serine peptidase [Proteobacteria bacterium]|nr:S8 family serine peptidase [Pseudomonadota bacterium]